MTPSLTPCRNIGLGKLLKKFKKKKLKIRPAEPLTFNKANRQKGKAVIITKVNGEVIIKKA